MVTLLAMWGKKRVFWFHVQAMTTMGLIDARSFFTQIITNYASKHVPTVS